MDRLAFLAASGAKQLMHRQETIANNLANASTNGFRADLDAFRSLPVQGTDADITNSRVYSQETTPAFDLTPGPMQATGRDLDIAVESEGFIAVEGRDGSEAYTRAGSLNVTADGILKTRSGLSVIGEGGPITIPENSRVTIGRDGTVSAATDAKTISVVGRIKLVNPATTEIVKGGDGLFRMANGRPAQVDETVRVVDGTVEGSNVNTVDALVSMISVSRQFEMQMRMLNNTDQNSKDAAKLLSANG